MQKTIRQDKYLDIKFFRKFTEFLGRLNVANDMLFRQSPPPDRVEEVRKICGTNDIKIYKYYGLKLLECKCIMERTFDYPSGD